MYAIHTTAGFIVDSRPYGEADRLLVIFTRDFGLITATALGIRLEKSKLRYFCQDYMFSTFSLVRGKEFWRLTSASEDQGISDDISGQIVDSAKNLYDRPLFARLAKLLRRLLHGEEAHPELFDVVYAAIRFSATQDLAGGALEDMLKNLESITVLRIMHLLGYIGDDRVLEPYLSYTELTPELVSSAARHRAALNLHINKALKESHL